MLTDDERNSVEEILIATLGIYPDKVVGLILGNAHAGSINYFPEPYLNAKSIVKYCEDSGWAEDPPLTVKLLKFFEYSDVKYKKILFDLLARQPAKLYKPKDHFEACLLHGKRVFINRKELRAALRDLGSQDGARVLIVNGPPLSGKSYSSELIWYLSAIFRSYKVVWIDLKQDIIREPSDLARSVMQQMGKSVENIPKQEAQAARWVQELRDWIIGNIATGNLDWWIVLDGFNKPDLPTETHDLIKHLAARAETTTRSLRLVLIEYSEPLPPNINRRVKRESISSISKPDLKDYFKQLAGHTDGEVNADGLDQLADAILSQIPVGAPDYLCRLSEAVDKVTEELLAK